MTESRDRFLARELEHVVAPDFGPRFEKELWEAIERRQRARSARWRGAAIAFALTTVAAASVASVLALRPPDRILDRSLQCGVPIRGGVPVFQVSASPAGRANVGGVLRLVPGLLWVGTDPSMRQALVAFQSAKAGYLLDQVACTAAARIPLDANGLRPYGIFERGDVGALRVQCFSASRIHLRAAARFSRSGVPVSATLSIVTGRRPRPLAYVEWSPARVTAYLSRQDCFDR